MLSYAKQTQKKGETMDYSKLRGRIVEKFGTCDKFSEVLRLSTVSISKKLNSRVGFSQKDIIKWSELLDIEENEYGVYFFKHKV